MLNKYIVLVVFFVFSINSFGQRNLKTLDGSAKSRGSKKAIFDDTLSNTSSRKVAKNLNAKIQDYKIISRDYDTIYLDTTLSISKEYKFNYLRRDYFNLLPFNNMGQTFNSLSENFFRTAIKPDFGSKAKHYNYMEAGDINYYNVPTPLTELMFKSNFVQGQLLDAFFTVNTSSQLNFSIAYKGMRSLGKYQHILSSSRNFRFTTSYNTKNKRYHLRTHFVDQEIINQENGGLSDEQILEFENGNSEFFDRSLFDPLFEDAENNLKGRRFYFDQSYQLKPKDSLGNNGIKLENFFMIEDKSYTYLQDRNSVFFGDSFVSSNILDQSNYNHINSEFNILYNNNLLGTLSGRLSYDQFNYGYNSLVIIDGQSITNRLKENALSVVGSYKNKIGNFIFSSDLGVNLFGDYKGNFFNAGLDFKIREGFNSFIKLNINSNPADFNYRLLQSDYLNYNWQNDFRNENTKQLSFSVDSEKYGILSSDYSTINNYLYFENKGLGVKPYQHNGTINYLRIKYEKEFKFRNFGLYNTVLFQNVLDGDELLNVPQLNTRQTLYYENYFFEKALFLQTGLTFSYFTKYSMNAYDPVLAEFYIQNDTSIGNFPRVDFFINAKIQQTRLFLKAEHFNSSYTGYNYYSAPNYPYRDFVIRFGIVWNFFL